MFCHGNIRKFADLVLIKTLFYTGVRVSELVNICISDVDLDRCQIRIQRGKGDKDRRYIPSIA
jgi:integrase/recombinase XerD